MKNTVAKSIIMAIVGCFSTIAAVENPSTAYIIIASLSFFMLYAVKDSWIKSDSEIFGLNKKDIVNGLLIAVAMTLSTIAANLLTGVEFDLIVTLKAVLYSIAGYLSKTFIQNNNSELLTLNKN